MAILYTLDDQIRIHIEDGMTLLIGRLLKCDVVMEDTSVSSQHARLHQRNGVLQLVDLGSTNGTRINYTLVEGPTVVLDGDTVEFGNVTFSVDGPELRQPPESGENPAIFSEKLDASQQIDNTMRIGDVEEEPVPEPDHAPEAPPAEPAISPLRVALVLSLILLSLAGVILLASVARIPAPN